MARTEQELWDDVFVAAIRAGKPSWEAEEAAKAALKNRPFSSPRPDNNDESFTALGRQFLREHTRENATHQ
jgi:hypothetical protein